MSHSYAVVLLWPNAGLHEIKPLFCWCYHHQQCKTLYPNQSSIPMLHIQTTNAMSCMQLQVVIVYEVVRCVVTCNDPLFYAYLRVPYQCNPTFAKVVATLDTIYLLN